ncbi:hypothetical protein BHE74_00051762 [Ensete ventricosum]|nr:hypothetical protein GW17_00059612 [Ensete ventricosum]RWW42662.1 hypothetical protein BHE74_00051762 [Ensete ventricosum]
MSCSTRHWLEGDSALWAYRVAFNLVFRMPSRVGGKGPQVRLERSVARVVKLRSGGDVSAQVDRWFLQEGQVEGFYSNGYGAPVPEVLTVPVAYNVVVLHHSFRGPLGEVRGVPPATGESRSCPLLPPSGRPYDG